MTDQQRRVFGMHYTLFNQTGTELESSYSSEPLLFLEKSEQIIPGLENEVVKMKVGEKKKIQVSAAEAYGEVRADLVFVVKRNQLPEKAEFKIGDQFQTEQGHHSPVFVIKSIMGDDVTLDGNHPMAGMDLTFDIEVTMVRNATAEELSHGHAHGGDGHHHH